MKKRIVFCPAFNRPSFYALWLSILLALLSAPGFSQTRKGNNTITPNGQTGNMTVEVVNMHKVADETRLKLETELNKLRTFKIQLNGDNSPQVTHTQTQLKRAEAILERAKQQALKMSGWKTFTDSQAQEVRNVFTDLNRQLKQLSAPARGPRQACVEDCDRAFPGATWGDAIQYTFCTYCCFLGSIEVKKGDASVKINCTN